jgi:putative membrane protein
MVLTPTETQKVEAAIAEVEQNTSAEIVVAALPRSGRYVDTRLWCALAVGLSAATLVHWLRPELGVSPILWVQAGAGAAAFVLASVPGVLRLLLPRQRAQRAVERAAELAFLEHAVFATRERIGVLILLSELEHKVVILGDEGIHARVQSSGWDALVGLLVQRIRERRAGDGLCEVIGKLGEQFARELPVGNENPNELDNRVRGPRRGSEPT